MIVYGLGKPKSHLYDDEAGAATVRALEVDGPLIMRDVEALDGSSLLQVDRSGVCKGKRKKRGEDRGLHYRNECKIFDFVVFVMGSMSFDRDSDFIRMLGRTTFQTAYILGHPM